MSRAQASGSGSNDAASFLFVVNEFDFDDDQKGFDQWLNYTPPSEADAYDHEFAGSVFRYHNGVVSPAPEFEWTREDLGGGRRGPGCIARRNPEYDQYVTMYPERVLEIYNDIPMHNGWPPMYREHSVFACSPFVPIIVMPGDASLGSFVRRGCECGEEHLPDTDGWRLLHFMHDNGVSRATDEARGLPYVGGRHPSWMPALVPQAFENRVPGNNQNFPQSLGLSGELPIVIALMAFHGRRGHASDVFTNGGWHRNQWRGPPGAQPHCEWMHLSLPLYLDVGRNNADLVSDPATDDPPRGFLVHVSLDLVPDDMPADTFSRIQEDERDRISTLLWGGILVRG